MHTQGRVGRRGTPQQRGAVAQPITLTTMGTKLLSGDLGESLAATSDMAPYNKQKLYRTATKLKCDKVTLQKVRATWGEHPEELPNNRLITESF